MSRPSPTRGIVTLTIMDRPTDGRTDPGHARIVAQYDPGLRRKVRLRRDNNEKAFQPAIRKLSEDGISVYFVCFEEPKVFVKNV